MPVTALAHPELTMIPRRPEPPRFSRTERETWTGAAWNLFVVKTAAPLQGRSEAISAISGLDMLEGLTPTCVPDTEKPLGYVPEVGTYFVFEAGIKESTGAEYMRAKLRMKLGMPELPSFPIFSCLEKIRLYDLLSRPC